MWRILRMFVSAANQGSLDIREHLETNNRQKIFEVRAARLQQQVRLCLLSVRYSSVRDTSAVRAFLKKVESVLLFLVDKRRMSSCPVTDIWQPYNVHRRMSSCPVTDIWQPYNVHRRRQRVN